MNNFLPLINVFSKVFADIYSDGIDISIVKVNVEEKTAEADMAFFLNVTSLKISSDFMIILNSAEILKTIKLYEIQIT